LHAFNTVEVRHNAAPGEHHSPLTYDALTLLALLCFCYYSFQCTGSKLFTLELVGHDEYTRKLLDDRAIFPQSFAQLAAARLAETLSSAKLAVRGVLRAAALAAEATANGSSSSVYANGGFAGDAAAAVSSSTTAANGASSDGRGRLTAAAFAKAVEQLESAAAAAAPTASTGIHHTSHHTHLRLAAIAANNELTVLEVDYLEQCRHVLTSSR
jgi:hypothetical protein